MGPACLENMPDSVKRCRKAPHQAGRPRKERLKVMRDSGCPQAFNLGCVSLSEAHRRRAITLRRGLPDGYNSGVYAGYMPGIHHLGMYTTYPPWVHLYTPPCTPLVHRAHADVRRGGRRPWAQGRRKRENEAHSSPSFSLRCDGSYGFLRRVTPLSAVERHKDWIATG